MPALSRDGFNSERDYQRVHKQLSIKRGKARHLKCTDCDQPALEWSRKHGADPLDISNYDPRCRRCHCKYDASENGGKRAHTKDTWPLTMSIQDIVSVRKALGGQHN